MILSLLLFELSFRVYLIDFYQPSFAYLNDQTREKGQGEELLIIGDSFSAFHPGYPQLLRDSLSAYNVTNVSVPGTSIREQYLIGRRHLKSIEPDVLLFQFYVGNDLFGWRHELNWQGVSTTRNIYWWLSERLWSLSYINHKLGNIRFNTNAEVFEKRAETQELPFSPDLYTTRDKVYFKAEKRLVENSVYLENGRGADLQAYMARMDKLFSFAGDKTRVYILITPHAAQLSTANMLKFEAIGAEFSPKFDPDQVHYRLYDDMIAYFGSDERVRVISPLAELRSLELSGKAVYHTNDSHLNDFGQRALGEYLLSVFRQSGLD